MPVTQDFTTHSKFKFSNSREGFEMALERARAELMRTWSICAIWRNTSRAITGRPKLIVFRYRDF